MYHQQLPTNRARLVLATILLAMTTMVGAALAAIPAAAAPPPEVVMLTADDFAWGTYIIDRPGTYRLAEDVSFNPNSPAALTAAVEDGTIPPELAARLDLVAPVDAYRAGFPLASQLTADPAGPFSPGGPTDARYDPAAYGVGFFAAIAVTADDVVIDLGGHTIEQSAEHALLQRFFSVIELADQPFVPGQGPAGFGDDLVAANRVTITNGTIGRSAHHGIHGNGNTHVRITDVDFVDYEVGAVALNGVDGLRVQRVTARNRKDVPVLGTFSSARFISRYIDDLVRSGSATTLTVGDRVLSAGDVQADLRVAINDVHADVLATGSIDPVAHPDHYALFHNATGLVDGNSYSFLLNSFGVAVNGFPTVPDGIDVVPARKARFVDVRVIDQQATITEVPAIDSNGPAPGGSAVIDPIGAVLQVRNQHPDTGRPVTVSSLDDAAARYVGNPVANAQFFVAKAAAAGDVGSGRLDRSRLNVPPAVVEWVEGRPGAETLADIDATWFCNGDSMFHVNKGAIGFKIDAATDVRLVRTSVEGLANHGRPGDGVCGDYRRSTSHPAATLHGYGGAAARAYTFAGSRDVRVIRAGVTDVRSASGPAIGHAVLTDSTDVRIVRSTIAGLSAGHGPEGPGVADGPAHAAGYLIGPEAGTVRIVGPCATGLAGRDGEYAVHDPAGGADLVGACRRGSGPS